MSMTMKYVDSGKLDVMLGTISRDCEKAGLDAQKEGGKIVKKAVVNRLKGIKTKDGLTRRRKKNANTGEYVHMADDVRISTRKDEFGDTVVRVQGGKKTGTLWHIVNDGTYRSRPTHFMDLALNDVEAELESIVDQQLKKVFE